MIIAKIFKQLDKAIHTLSKKYSENPDIKKGIKHLEFQVKKLFELYTSNSAIKEAVDDSSFVKKPLGGYSCASCEKELTGLYNLINQQPEYANWNKFPVRDPNERALKVIKLIKKFNRQLGFRKF